MSCIELCLGLVSYDRSNRYDRCKDMETRLKDQKCSYYTVGIQTKKWPPRIFFFLLERSIVNAFICELESTNHNPHTQLEFRVDLIQTLIENYHGRKNQGRSRFNPLESRFTERHFPQHVPYNEKGVGSENVLCAKLLGGSRDAHLSAWNVMWDFVWPHASGIITQDKTGTFCLSLSANDNF